MEIMSRVVIYFLSLMVLAYTPSSTKAENSRYRKLTRTKKSVGYPPKHIAPLHLSSSRTLVTVGDTLYLLNGNGRVVWKWDVGEGLDILDLPFVDSRGRIYGVAFDGVSFSLDQKGRLRWRKRMNGAWYYTRMIASDKDRYLMFSAIDSAYRDSGDPTIETITLCQDQKILAEAAIPRDSAVRVRGRRIYVTTRRGRKFHSREVKLRWRP
jgi:hypothetical protein